MAGRLHQARRLCTQRVLLGLPLRPQVNKWFEKQRKAKREATGEPSKRGRPSAKGASGSAAKAAAAAVPAADEQAAAAPADEAAPAQEPPAGEAMDVDAEPAAQQVQQAQQEEQQPAPAAAELGEAAAEPMASEEEAPAAGDAAPVPAAAATADGGSEASPQPASAAAAAPAKTPAAAASPPRMLSADQKAELVASLEAEAEQLRQEGLAAPLQPLPAAGAEPAERQAFSDARLAAAVAGQRAPLSQLVAVLLPVFKAPGGEAPVEEAVLRRWGLFSVVGRGLLPRPNACACGCALPAWPAMALMLTLAPTPLPFVLQPHRRPGGPQEPRPQGRRQRAGGRAGGRRHGAPVAVGAARSEGAPLVGGGGLVAAARWDVRGAMLCSTLRAALSPLHLPSPLQVLPKELRPAAAQAKKRAARVAERLGAVGAALRLLGPHREGQVAPKLAKALAALDKAKVGWAFFPLPASYGRLLKEICLQTPAPTPPSMHRPVPAPLARRRWRRWRRSSGRSGRRRRPRRPPRSRPAAPRQRPALRRRHGSRWGGCPAEQPGGATVLPGPAGLQLGGSRGAAACLFAAWARGAAGGTTAALSAPSVPALQAEQEVAKQAEKAAKEAAREAERAAKEAAKAEEKVGWRKHGAACSPWLAPGAACIPGGGLL